MRRASHDREERLREEDGGEERDDRADTEREREALDAGAREDEQDERGEQGDDVRVDDRRDALAVALADRRQRRAPEAQLLLYSLEDDDVRVGRDADREDQPRDARQGQRDRDDLDHRQVEEGVDREPERGDEAEEAVVDEQEEHDERRGPRGRAMIAPSSASWPRVAETVDWLISASSTGSAPIRRNSARSCASVIEKLPEI